MAVHGAPRGTPHKDEATSPPVGGRCDGCLYGPSLTDMAVQSPSLLPTWLSPLAHLAVPALRRVLRPFDMAVLVRRSHATWLSQRIGLSAWPNQIRSIRLSQCASLHLPWLSHRVSYGCPTVSLLVPDEPDGCPLSLLPLSPSMAVPAPIHNGCPQRPSAVPAPSSPSAHPGYRSYRGWLS